MSRTPTLALLLALLLAPGCDPGDDDEPAETDSAGATESAGETDAEATDSDALPQTSATTFAPPTPEPDPNDHVGR